MGKRQQFECVFCQKVFSSLPNLQYHVKSHLAERPYWCSKCDKVYKSNRSLRPHNLTHSLQTHPTVKSQGICEVCGTQLNTWTAVLYHRELHSGQKLQCTQCSKLFKIRISLNRHIKRVHKSASIVECNICGKKLKHAAYLPVHMRCHTNERPYECSVCKKKFVQAAHLRTHRQIHESEKRFSCSTCGKAFFQAQVCKSHQRVHSTDRTIKKHWCIMCNKGFPELGYLLRHCRTHTKEVTHPCSKCSSAFYSKSKLKFHIREVHQKVKPFGCELCGNRFAREATLHNHISSHLKEKPYKCSICDRSFRLQNTLTKHGLEHEKDLNLWCVGVDCKKRFLREADLLKHYLRIHIGSTEDLLTCVFCGKTLTTLGILEDHTRMHILERPFDCPRCDKCYSSAAVLLLHRKWHGH